MSRNDKAVWIGLALYFAGGYLLYLLVGQARRGTFLEAVLQFGFVAYGIGGLVACIPVGRRIVDIWDRQRPPE